MNVEIEKIGESKLSKQMWRFWYDERVHALVLDAYVVSHRETRRHAWRTSKSYHRIMSRSGNLPEPEGVPHDIAIEAAQMFFGKLMVVTERDRRRG